MRRYVSLDMVLLLLLLPVIAYAQPAHNDFKQTKEWKALNRYVGVWDNATATVGDPTERRDVQTAAWIVGDRFLQIKSKSDDAHFDWVLLLTYDPNRRAMRYWWFFSNGYALQSSGSWDEATSTFAYKSEDAGPMMVVGTDRFIDDDHHEWRMTAKDADGKTTYQASGKSTRQKRTADRAGTREAAVVRAADDPPKTAAETIHRFWELRNAGDVDAAQRYLHSPPDAFEARSWKRAADEFKGGQTIPVLVESKEDGDVAAVISKTVVKVQGEFYSSYVLLRKDGRWRFCMRKDDPEIDEPIWARMELLRKWAMERDQALRQAVAKPAMTTLPRAVANSQNNMKQLLAGIKLYASDCNGILPDKIEQVIEACDVPDKVLRNPRQPDRQNGYVWVKPAEKISQVQNAAQAIVLYEAYDTWPKGGLIVGYLDGHVDVLKDEQMFKQKLEAQKTGKTAP